MVISASTTAAGHTTVHPDSSPNRLPRDRPQRQRRTPCPWQPCPLKAGKGWATPDARGRSGRWSPSEHLLDWLQLCSLFLPPPSLQVTHRPLPATPMPTGPVPGGPSRGRICSPSEDTLSTRYSPHPLTTSCLVFATVED